MNSKQSILIVDDDHNVLEVLDARLSSSGFRVLKAAGAREALQLLKGQRVDLIISDMKMPGMGGMELFNEIRSFKPGLLDQGKSTSIPAIFSIQRSLRLFFRKSSPRFRAFGTESLWNPRRYCAFRSLVILTPDFCSAIVTVSQRHIHIGAYSGGFRGPCASSFTREEHKLESNNRTQNQSRRPCVAGHWYVWKDGSGR